MPTLCHALPAYEAMITKWQELKQTFPEASDIIQEGLDKLDIYENYTDLTPAYSLAMGMCLLLSL
jgi:hypothetical protein